MKTALYDGIEVTPAEHRRLARSNWKELDRWPTCKICKRRVHPTNVNSTNALDRFDHLDGVRDCLLSSAADPRYLTLRPSEVDLEYAKTVREVFLGTPLCDRAFQFCKYHVGKSFNQSDFNKLIDRADKITIWGYRNLQLWTVAYAMLTLDDFLIRTQEREFDVQFRFDKPKSGLIDDLWLRPDQCKLEKIYRDTGNLCNFPEGNPYPLSEIYFWGNRRRPHNQNNQ